VDLVEGSSYFPRVFVELALTVEQEIPFSVLLGEKVVV